MKTKQLIESWKNADAQQPSDSPANSVNVQESVMNEITGGANSAGEIPNPTSDPAGASQAIHAVSVKDGRVMRLAEGSSPVVSPTDRRVVFSKDGQIHLVEIVDGSEPHQLFSARGSNFTPRWSPDGKQLAFNSSRSTHSLIAIYDFEKQMIRYIAPSVDRDSAPRWSLDGKKIAFIRQPARGNAPRAIFQDAPDPWTIWVADAATGTACAGTTRSYVTRSVTACTHGRLAHAKACFRTSGLLLASSNTPSLFQSHS